MGGRRHLAMVPEDGRERLEWGSPLVATLDEIRARLDRLVRAITGGRGADFVFVTVGAKAAADQSYDMLAKGGAAIMVGMPPVGVKSEFEIVTLADTSQRILGSKMGSSNIHRDIPNFVDLYRQGRLQLDELITGR